MQKEQAADGIAGVISTEDDYLLPEKTKDSYFKKEIALLECRMIEKALEETGGNRLEAARRLGIHRSLLYKKMEEYRML